MRKYFFAVLVFELVTFQLWALKPQGNKGWTLVWSDEFNKAGKPDTASWNYEHGFVRNEGLASEYLPCLASYMLAIQRDQN